MKKIILTLSAIIISLMSYSQNMIDVHSHILPQKYFEYLSEHNALMQEGFPLPKWNINNHLRVMENNGIKTSILSLAAPQPYFGNIKESRKIVRLLNEESAKLKEKHPQKILWAATLPLPDVKEAIQEAKYALDTLHADAIKLATNVDGQYLGAPELDSLMAFLSSRRAIIILHPHKPEPVNEQVMKQTPLAMQEYLSETTRCIANMISRNVLARYPGIKVIVPHCGAYLPIAIQRMKAIFPVMRQNKLIGEIDWQKNLAALYYDLAGSHSPEIIRSLLTITTPDHLLYGSDYPYVAENILTASLQNMEKYLSVEADLKPYKEMILWKNAQNLFHLQMNSERYSK